jgi:transaldolase
MRKAVILDYEAFARNLLRAVPDRPVSLEVFARDEASMEAQARAIASWGPNVNVKIPVTDENGVFLGPLIHRLSCSGVTVNVTAILTLSQVERVAAALHPETPAIVSVFAGRVADTANDPVPTLLRARQLLSSRPRAELLWASPRELLNIFQADAAGCHIITVPPEILVKLSLIGKDLAHYSRETVSMFHRDAHAAAYHIQTPAPAPTWTVDPAQAGLML